MEPAERLDFSRPPNPVLRTFGGMFVLYNKAVFAGRRGMLPPADPTHSGLTPLFAPNHISDNFRLFRVLCVPHSESSEDDDGGKFSQS